MDSDNEEFDYRSFLSYYSNQDESQEKRESVDVMCVKTFATHQTIMKLYNNKRKFKGKLRASAKKCSNIGLYYKGCLNDYRARLSIAQDQMHALKNDVSVTELLLDMETSSMNYRNVDSDFGDGALKDKVILHKRSIPVIFEEDKQLEVIHQSHKEVEFESEKSREETRVLLPVSNSITLEKAKKFSDSNFFIYSNYRIANSIRNIESLKKNVAESKVQLNAE